jgi:hypothetical protein
MIASQMTSSIRVKAPPPPPTRSGGRALRDTDGPWSKGLQKDMPSLLLPELLVLDGGKEPRSLEHDLRSENSNPCAALDGGRTGGDPGEKTRSECQRPFRRGRTKPQTGRVFSYRRHLTTGREPHGSTPTHLPRSRPVKDRNCVRDLTVRRHRPATEQSHCAGRLPRRLRLLATSDCR